MDEFFKISELAKKAGLPSSTVRHYLKIGLIEPAIKGENNYFYFDETTLDKLITIKELRQNQKSIDEIRGYFKIMEGLV